MGRQGPRVLLGLRTVDGATEGDRYGLWNAREYLSGGSVLEDDHQAGSPPEYVHPDELDDEPNCYSPVALYSEDIHYSISKALRALVIPTVSDLASSVGLDPERFRHGVPCHGEDDPQGRAGEMDLSELERAAAALIAAGYPLLLTFNYGTAFRRVYDDVAAGVRLVDELIIAHHGSRLRKVRGGQGDLALSDTRTWAWYHVDGALGAAFAPYLTGTNHELPGFDFHSQVHSISTSGHKWLGAPWPLGVFMTKRRYQLRPPHVPYIGGSDSTFGGSRNGLSAVLLWTYLARSGVDANQTKATRLQDLADLTEAKLRDLDREISQRHGLALNVQRSRRALTLRFRKLSNHLVDRYSLSCSRLHQQIDGVTRQVNVSHLFIMDHVDEALINRFISDIRDAGAGAVHPDYLVG